MRLSLSDDQVIRVQDIIEKRHRLMIAHRNGGSQKMHKEFEVMVEEVASELDDIQASSWRGIAEHVRKTYLPELAGG